MGSRLQTLLVLALPALAATSRIPTRHVTTTTTNPGFVSFPIRRGSRTLAARDATASLINEQDTSYLVELTFGSNAQSVNVAIDTGSDELFVDPSCNDRSFTQSQQQDCTENGQYDPSTSSTSKVTQETSQITYGSGAVDIQYVVDNIGIPGAGATMTGVQFGVATASQGLNEGILGLGFGRGVNLNYSNFVDQLATQGVTKTRVFSVALGTSDTAGGNIIFGGVDTKKFSGSLATSTIQSPAYGDIQRYSIQMNGLTFKSGSTSNKYSGSDLSVVLDTGSSLCLLPTSVVSSMAEDFNAKQDASSGLLIVSCSFQNTDGSLDFEFDGVTVSVPFSEFILSAGGNQCILGVQAVESNSGITALLGDTFLRSAYVVFDQDQNKISMAQYVDCGTNEQVIASGSNGASGFKGECSGSTAGSSKSAGELNRPAAGTSIIGFVTGVAALVSLF
ncbi:candidapepsin-8 [Diaporthe helianthi]|uniref:Candidapepsin-8 n=1 Tax=Diaporthe helianthi TaxID=158607 RepID=A0A2P5HG20_DIAHE|nr:candidapepsin-8 [Diaporthe helianthi]